MRFVALALVVALACGCATMTPAEKVYWQGAAADLATTAYGLEECGGREANPALTLAGEGTAEVLLSGLALKGLYWWIFKDKAQVMYGSGLMQFVVGGMNAGTIASSCG